MDREQTTPWAADLVANLGWVQRLALSLARNRDAADDLTQEVARVWLERRPELEDRPRGLKAWLAAVTRRLARDRARSELARRAREQAVARPEADGDTYEVVERGAWQKRVTEAVMELAEPYRSTILYCYLDQLPTRTVAERMDVQEATVRKRLERGLALLRKRLHGDTDDDRTARPLLLSWADKSESIRKATAGLNAKLTGILLMTTKAKLVSVAIAVALLLLLTLRMGVEPTDHERSGAAATPAPNALSGAARQGHPERSEAAVAREADATPVEREAVAVPVAPTTGSLLVHVVWSDDKKPAPGVLLSLYRSGADPLFEEPSATSDEDGAIRFAGLQSGSVHTRIVRGDENWSEPIQIVTGKEIESTVEVKIGMDCRGVVVDDKDRPIADAEVLVASWAGTEAHPLARTGPDGSFTLRAVATHCHIGARAPGYAASSLREFTAGKGAKVEFRIVLGQAAAELSGVVLDPQGHPVADAVVQAGNGENKLEKMSDGTVARPPMPERVRTDERGQFAFHSVPAGSVPLAVRARRLSPWSQPLELRAGESKSVTVQLEAGVILLGTVRDAAGAKVAKASIQVGEWDELSHRVTSSDSDGDFRVEGVASGDVKVRAEREGLGTAESTLHASAGETVRWNVELSTGVVLRGLVLDADDKPVKSASVEAIPERGSRDVFWSGFESTDDAGHFSLKNCIAGQPLHITVSRKSTFPEAALRNVVPGGEELVIHLPREAWVYIQGKVLDPEDKVLPNVHVSPFMKGGNGSPAETVDPSTGSFRYGPYPPGEYQLHVQADGYPTISLPWRVLAPDEVWDVGTLKLQRGGSLLVKVVGSQPVPRHCWFSIVDATGTHVDNLEVEDGTGRAGPFVPGSYFVQVSGEGIACTQQPVEVRAGMEMRVDVQMQKGVGVEIEVPLPESVLMDDGVRVVITNGSGSVVMNGTAWAAGGAPKMSLSLLPGGYRIEASKGALRGNESFTVLAGAEPTRVSVRLIPR